MAANIRIYGPPEVKEEQYGHEELGKSHCLGLDDLVILLGAIGSPLA